MQKSARGLTALDVAGKHQSDEAAIVLLNFYKDNFMMLADLFKSKGSSAYIAGWEKFKPLYDPVQVCRAYEDKKGPDKPWVLRIVSDKGMSDDQRDMATVYYWAGVYGERDIVLLFLEFLHLSPFAKLFRGCSVVDGCVQGHQIELLKLLIEETTTGNKNDACRRKYTLEKPDFAHYYWKSRKGKNDLGNNTAHFAFEIDDEELRYQVLELLVQEQVGDIDKPNIKGLEPYEIEHTQPIDTIPP